MFAFRLPITHVEFLPSDLFNRFTGFVNCIFLFVARDVNSTIVMCPFFKVTWLCPKACVWVALATDHSWQLHHNIYVNINCTVVGWSDLDLTWLGGSKQGMCLSPKQSWPWPPSGKLATVTCHCSLKCLSVCGCAHGWWWHYRWACALDNGPSLQGTGHIGQMLLHCEWDNTGWPYLSKREIHMWPLTKY